MITDRALQALANLHAEEEDPMMKGVLANMLAEMTAEQAFHEATKEDK